MTRGTPVRLRGSTWNHPRGYAPLLALADRHAPGVVVEWDVRSLRDFGEQSVATLATQYDLVVFDHPSVGEGARESVIKPLDDLVDSAVLDSLANASVGPSWDSYLVDGRPYALPIDAAGQVSASRGDMIQALPQSWAEAYELAAASATAHARVALPLVDTDVVCLFMTLLASSGTPMFAEDHEVADREKVLEILEFMHRLSKLLHPGSLEWNPIQLLDHMSLTDEISYCPALFGYSNYSRIDTVAQRLRFGPIPDWGDHPARPLLGGAGIAISAFSPHVDIAASVVAELCRSETQRGVYFYLGGQPAHRDAWTDEGCNVMSSGFFSNTLESLDNAYLRPRKPGFTSFQASAGVILRTDAIIAGNIDLAAERLDVEWRRLTEELT
jgi:multiple sugar transport system substrate-binding protein